MNRKLAGTFIALLGFGIVAGAGMYALDKYKERQAFEALLKNCGSCANKHSAHLRNKALKEQMQAGELTMETQNTQN